jgi:hypothetical protein
MGLTPISKVYSSALFKLSTINNFKPFALKES